MFQFTGLTGGSASGKTTIAEKIIKALNLPWVVLLSMDSFYKVVFKKIYITIVVKTKNIHKRIGFVAALPCGHSCSW